MRVYSVAFFVLIALLANGEAAKSLTGNELITATFTGEIKAMNKRALRDNKGVNTVNIEQEERLPIWITNLLKKIGIKVASNKIQPVLKLIRSSHIVNPP